MRLMTLTVGLWAANELDAVELVRATRLQDGKALLDHRPIDTRLHRRLVPIRVGCAQL